MGRVGDTVRGKDLSDDKVLSICWVTYNDSSELSTSLSRLRESFLLGKPMGLNRAEVIISDNCSTDDTQVLIQKETSSLPVTLLSFLQQRNLGFRGNLEFCAQAASGEWVLFLGAGDVLDLEAAAEFIECSKDRFSECNVVYFNSSSRDERTGVIEERTYGWEEKPAFSQAPMPIFRTSVLREIINSDARISGDHWPQVEWALSASSASSSQVGVLPKILISSSRPARGWWSKPNAFLVPMALLPVLEKSLSAFRWNEAAIKEKLYFSIFSPSLWVYQSRAVHGSVRASMIDLFSYWRYSKFSLRAAIAFALVLVSNALPVHILKAVGSLLRKGRVR
jgi:glycosyltransferase involved in cell wall biosynthesis